MFGGCTKEDITDCGIAVRFIYDKNVFFQDKFGEQVKSIHLYIFDSNGAFLESHEADGAHQPGGIGGHLPRDFTMTLTHIKPGNYTLVAWGNLSEHVSFTERSFPTVSEAGLSLNVEADGIARFPEVWSLFHRHLPLVVEKNHEGTQEVVMDLTKFTNLIEVKQSGLPVSPYATSTPFDCLITSKNRSYRFDGSYSGDEVVTYHPFRASIESNAILSSFNVLRELNNNATDSRLTVLHNLPNGDVDVLYDEPLVELLIKSQGHAFDQSKPNNTGDLDRDDEFRIETVFDLTSGTVTIYINDWRVVTTTLPPL